MHKDREMFLFMIMCNLYRYIQFLRAQSHDTHIRIVKFVVNIRKLILVLICMSIAAAFIIFVLFKHLSQMSKARLHTWVRFRSVISQ